APLYASDYFDKFYEYAVQLIHKGKAYVCDMTPEETDAYRRLGKASGFRDRSAEENLDLFARMKAGEFADGARTLRAKIDVNAANVWLRDPVLYRIRHASHHRTGDKWCIYPMYDWAHTLSDYIEGITHSICTLEFEVHRPLYDWIVDALALLSPTRRDEFNRPATRRLVLLRPIKLVLTNYPEGKIEEHDAINNPEDANAGTRKIPFGRELYIEQDDFMETPPPKYFRLRPG